MIYPFLNPDDTICAISTPPGSGAIAVVRLSGPKALEICGDIFKPVKAKSTLSNARSHSIHLGTITSSDGLLDEVLVSVFKAPHSYTGENVVEISCHGSMYIQRKLIELLIDRGCRQAQPGEFTLRAFLNGRFDLSQAEAVADLIAADARTSHDLALNQMRGGFSQKIKELRQQLVDFTSLLELELDFSEEDVEFADRTQLMHLLTSLKKELDRLITSFSLGNVIKQGIPVAIIGKPNVGKSTLLNAILNEERAIVSEIPGTTRDYIEDTIVIDGISFRFIDTAGLRHARDELETIGIERTYEKISQAEIILYVCDVSECTMDDTKEVIGEFREMHKDTSKRWILIGNKIDKLVEIPRAFLELLDLETIFVSAKRKENINLILESLVRSVNAQSLSDTSLVSNTRHYEALVRSQEAVAAVEKGFHENVPTDLIAIDIKQALYHLGEITGEITNEEILGNIFSRFCVGK
ncbi:MAG: tRNA uridine-5-carboxymethylaminomethyl(34) synthesis GTPase MnmE [Bacteroidetes bacterium]|nr:tRNA uridine-5-carboxymethylaminomethyl(34) synthesis GTPase MnmE [Bacteroidota bacterium]